MRRSGNIGLRPQVSGAGGFAGRGGRRAAVGLALAGVALGLPACGPGHGTDCLKSAGKVITERRDVPAGLRTLTTFDNVDVIIVPDTETYAEVRAGKNVIEDIEFTVKGDALEISNTAKCNWVRSYDNPHEVTLHVAGLPDIFLRGSGNISTATPLRQDTTFLHLIGAGDFNLELVGTYCNADMYERGDFNLRGSLHTLTLTVGGNGRFFGQDMRTQAGYFRTTRDSDGDAHIRASYAVGGTVAGTGTVYYAGSPAIVDIEVTGRGKARAE